MSFFSDLSCCCFVLLHRIALHCRQQSHGTTWPRHPYPLPPPPPRRAGGAVPAGVHESPPPADGPAQTIGTTGRCIVHAAFNTPYAHRVNACIMLIPTNILQKGILTHAIGCHALTSSLQTPPIYIISIYAISEGPVCGMRQQLHPHPTYSSY